MAPSIIKRQFDMCLDCQIMFQTDERVKIEANLMEKLKSETNLNTVVNWKVNISHAIR